MKLLHGDCLDRMSEVDSKSVDLIVIDPPYNIKKADWDKRKTVQDYVDFMGLVFKQCERVLKDNGSFYFFHNDMPQVSKMMVWIEECTDFIFKQLIVWNKRFNEANNKGFLDGFVEVGGLRNYQTMAVYLLFYTFQDETGLKLIEKDIDNNERYLYLIEYYMTESLKCFT